MARDFLQVNRNYLNMFDPTLAGRAIDTNDKFTCSVWATCRDVASLDNTWGAGIFKFSHIANRINDVMLTVMGSGAIQLFRWKNDVTDLTGKQRTVATGLITDDVIHHYCVRWDGTTLELFLDGVLQSLLAGTTTATGWGNSTIGRSDSGTTGGFYWEGQIQEMACWASSALAAVLSDEEIASLAQGQSPYRFCRSTLKRYYPLWGNGVADIAGEVESMGSIGSGTTLVPHFAPNGVLALVPRITFNGEDLGVTNLTCDVAATSACTADLTTAAGLSAAVAATSACTAALSLTKGLSASVAAVSVVNSFLSGIAPATTQFPARHKLTLASTRNTIKLDDT